MSESNLISSNGFWSSVYSFKYEWNFQIPSQIFKSKCWLCKLDCSEGLRTSFITDMRSVVRVRAQGFLIRPCLQSRSQSFVKGNEALGTRLPCLLSRTRFGVVCPLNEFKVRSDVLFLNFDPFARTSGSRARFQREFWTWNVWRREKWVRSAQTWRTKTSLWW